MAEEKKYRYPGINSFETDDADIFFGRDDDRRKLADVVEVEKSTLLYSRSGLGKSSLLKAALVPELIERGHQPYYIRLGLYQSDSLPPVQHVLRRTVLAEQKGAPVTFLHKFLNRTNSLWSVFKAIQIASCPEEKPIVLIFDQFEEVGSYRDHIGDFTQQLAELLYTPIPQQYLEALADEEMLTEPLTDAEIELLYKPLRIKAVFAVRSDQLSVMNELSDYLPNVLKIYYELKPLSVRQARRAVEEPAKRQGSFVTPPFTYHTAAVDKIIQSLDQKGKNEVDTAQLQILLQHVEQDIVERGWQTNISAADLGNLNDVYRNYYHNSLQKLENEQAAAEELIEDTLIAEGRRVSYDEALFRKRVSAATLDTLIKVRLLRQEPNTMGGYSYEISHDSLVEPILQTREERKRREEAAARQASFAAQLAEQHKKTARQRLILYIALAALVLSAGFATWAVRERNKADEANSLAQQNLAKANKLIGAFYFYDDKFALALKRDAPNHYLFYFIDRAGNPVNKLGKWEKAGQFDFMGLAKVQNGADYIIDTTGRTCRAAYEIDNLDSSITALDLNEKVTTVFPAPILKNEQLQILRLKGAGNKMSLPPDMGRLHNLVYLSLDSCNIDSLPVQIGRLKNIRFLNVSNSELTALPPQITELKNLVTLDVYHNQITTLPPQIAAMEGLAALYLGNNQFTSLPVQVTKIKNLTTLWLDSNQLVTLPSEIAAMKNLTFLNLSDNKLTALPAQIGDLKNLSNFGLYNNKLTSVPEQIGALQNLTGLDLGMNQLAALPVSVTTLKKLFVIGLQANQIKKLPAQIGELKNLTKLYLNENQLSALPPQIGELKSLTELDLDKNNITALPSQIGELKNLTILYLSNNKLTTLPEQIGELKNLRNLYLEGNNFSAAEKNRIHRLLPDCKITF